jgi:hypothetical protein
MSSKERKARAILKLLEDMKWPSLSAHDKEGRVHGGLLLIPPDHVPDDKEAITVGTDEIYIGRYSPLADAIRDWQDTPHEPNYDVMKFQQIHDQRVRDAEARRLKEKE